ncbi:MAG: restriction endonuclease subunit S [Rubrivivax sp.]|nr:restriction endonuclease subunit S [Rubrivivax sp.]
MSLSDVAEVVRGVTYQREVALSNPCEGYIPVLRAGNIQDELVLNDDLVWLPAVVVSDRQLLRPNDVLMCTSSGSADVVGKSALFDTEGWSGSFGAFCAVIRANHKACLPAYLRYVLRAPEFLSWARSSLGANIKNIRKSELELFKFHLPSLSEQLRIAAILDKAGGLRRKRQEAIRLADDLLSSAFVDMFGAPGSVAPSLPTQPLGDVCRFYAGNSLPEGEPFVGQLDGVLHIKVGDMNLPGNESVVSTSREWSANGAGGIVAPKGAILIPKRGGAIATNKKRVLGRPCALDPNLMAISPGSGLRQELLFQWFKLFDLSTITSGSAVPQLNKGDLAPLRIVVPPVEQQDRFAEIAHRVTSIVNRQAIQLGDIESACRALTAELLSA